MNSGLIAWTLRRDRKLLATAASAETGDFGVNGASEIMGSEPRGEDARGVVGIRGGSSLRGSWMEVLIATPALTCGTSAIFGDDFGTFYSDGWSGKGTSARTYTHDKLTTL